MHTNRNARREPSARSLPRAVPPPASAAEKCFWKQRGLCRGLRRVEADGRLICACAEALMAPNPGQVLEAFADLGLTDEQIGHYFHLPAPCVTALRRPA